MINKLLELFTSSDFIVNYWRNKPLLIPDQGNLFLELSKIAGFEDLMNQYWKVFPDTIFFLNKGLDYPFKRNLDESQFNHYLPIIKSLYEKSPIVAYGFHKINPFFKKIADLLQKKFQASSMQAGIYLSKNKVKGLKKHRDRSHIFVFQIKGRCRWILHGRSKNRFIDTVILNPGDILYVPQGIYHRLERIDDEVTHVTVGLRYRNPRKEMSIAYKSKFLNPSLPKSRQSMDGKDLKKYLEKFSNRPLKPEL